MIFLDTNVLDAIVQGRFGSGYILRGKYAISVITLGECLRGRLLHPDNRTMVAVANLAEELDGKAILPYGPKEARVFARIASKVTARKRIPDLMIASTAIVANLPLFTYDAGLDAIGRDIAADDDSYDLTVHLLGT